MLEFLIDNIFSVILTTSCLLTTPNLETMSMSYIQKNSRLRILQTNPLRLHTWIFISKLTTEKDFLQSCLTNAMTSHLPLSTFLSFAATFLPHRRMEFTYHSLFVTHELVACTRTFWTGPGFSPTSCSSKALSRKG